MHDNGCTADIVRVLIERGSKYAEASSCCATRRVDRGRGVAQRIGAPLNQK